MNNTNSWLVTTLLLPALLTLSDPISGQYFQYLLGEEEPGFTGTHEAVELSDGNIIVRQSGPNNVMRLMKVSAGGDLLWSRDHHQPGASMVPGPDGDLYLVSKAPMELEFVRIYVSRVGNDGSISWRKGYLISVTDPFMYPSGPSSMQVFYNGELQVLDIMIFETWYSAFSACRVRINGNGDVVWSKKGPPELFTSALSHPPGRTLAYGNGGSYSLIPMPHWHSGVITRWDDNGNDLWSVTVKMTNGVWDYRNATLAMTDDGVYVYGSADNNQNYDHPGFIFKLDQNGVLEWYRLVETSAGSTQMGLVDEVGNVSFGDHIRITFNQAGNVMTWVRLVTHSYFAAPYEHALNVKPYRLQNGDALLTGSWWRHDPVFDYHWSTPVLMRVHPELENTCHLAVSMAMPSDTLVPAAFIELHYLSSWTDLPVTSEDQSEYLVEDQPLPMVINYCVILGAEDGAASAGTILYPNPIVSGMTGTLQLPSPGTYEILDVSGRTLSSGSSKSTTHSIATDHLAPGTYLVRQRSMGGSIPDPVLRFVVQ
jgi:hypothetical protein